jgi:subtilisin family serine protease
VASLLIGHSGEFHGAVPGAELYAADVYCGAATGGAVDAVAEAFGWLSGEHVPVINVSLVGPANAILEKIVQSMIKRGHTIVAAVGNDGPSAAAMYPASYVGVIGVTAVDAKRRVLLEAARGKQVDFAAPGADMIAANGVQSFSAVRGTSFAAPIVAGLLARSLPSLDPAAAEHAFTALAGQAIDLGSRGPDRTYGNGLIGQDLRTAPRMADMR